MKLSFVSKFCLALLLGLVTVFYIDPLDKSTVSTPFCLGVVLMAFSLRQSTALVVAVSLAYTALTAYSLVQFHQYYSTHIYANPHPYFWLFQRTGLFIVLCMTAIYLAHYRNATERILSRLRIVLGKLPSPVIISDVSGNIVYANEAVELLLQQPSFKMVGDSYFNWFFTEAEKGESIRAYFDLFESNTHQIRELEVRSAGASEKVHAQLSSLGTGSNRIMITVILPTEKLYDLPKSEFREASLQANLGQTAQKL
jgi:PAS domain-containing protein